MRFLYVHGKNVKGRVKLLTSVHLLGTVMVHLVLVRRLGSVRCLLALYYLTSVKFGGSKLPQTMYSYFRRCNRTEIVEIFSRIVRKLEYWTYRLTTE